jgi:TAG lipase/steryl ester hydrolase/phospholipase A2/LPA acyltransferase
LTEQLIQLHKNRMNQSTNYSEWKDAAQTLDSLEYKDIWKRTIASDIYNYEMLSDRLFTLRKHREQGELKLLARALREGLHHDLGNMGDIRLYQQSYFGTKQLIEDYVTEVCDCLDVLSDSSSEVMSASKKLDFFKDVLLSFGRPALLLSGGASLGVFHVGVVKALWEHNLLPQVVTGSSAGSIIAAALGTHTDSEIPSLFDPNVHNIKAWRWMGLLSGLKGKGFMDQKQLQDYIRSYVGEYTFQEAYERTGRSINITVSPVQHHQKERLLCGYTSPYLLTWSAALASCAVPGIFPPVKLLKRDQFGKNVPYMPRLRWVDGSVVSDLPVERLMHLYDVNYTVVSQTNPHVVPFLDRQIAQASNKLLNLPMSIFKAEAKFHGKAVFDYIRKNTGSQVLRQVSGHAYSMMSQNYYGDVTIAPKYKLAHYLKILSNTDHKMIKELMLEGERATWPKLAMIRTHAKISKNLEDNIARLKRNVRSHSGKLKLIS